MGEQLPHGERSVRIVDRQDSRIRVGHFRHGIGSRPPE